METDHERGADKGLLWEGKLIPLFEVVCEFNSPEVGS